MEPVMFTYQDLSITAWVEGATVDVACHRLVEFDGQCHWAEFEPDEQTLKEVLEHAEGYFR